MRGCTVAASLRKMSSIMDHFSCRSWAPKFSNGLHRLMSQGTQRLNQESFLVLRVSTSVP